MPRRKQNLIQVGSKFSQDLVTTIDALALLNRPQLDRSGLIRYIVEQYCETAVTKDNKVAFESLKKEFLEEAAKKKKQE